jgi:trans-2,3-dihydro-3-hydroxyanthranilate isomerase
MVAVPYLLLDVFTDTQFEGNPLAVVIDPPRLSDAQLLRIAREFNLSETIFLTRDGGDRWSTRIFTPVHELAFAGHPTVGGAIALIVAGRATASAVATIDDPTVVLAQGAGNVPVAIVGDGGAAVATFRAPRAPVLDAPIGPDQSTRVLAALGLEANDAHTSLGPGVWNAGVPITVLPISTVEALARVQVDTGRLAELVADGLPPEFYLLAPDPEGADRWRARMFAPGIGIAEDPATGAAAVAGAGLLSTVAPDGEARWHVEQGVEMGRRSVLDLSATVRGGMAIDARLGGRAVLVGEGTLHLTD